MVNERKVIDWARHSIVKTISSILLVCRVDKKIHGLNKFYVFSRNKEVVDKQMNINM